MGAAIGQEMPLESASVRERLRESLARLRGDRDLPREACEPLEEKLVSNAFNVVVVGQFKRGKTSFVNALLGEELLPVGVVPLTSIVTLLFYGEHLAIEVRYEDRASEAIARERLADYVTESGNPQNAKRVREVAIAFPSPWLKRGVRLVDTPGIGSAYQHNTDVAQRFLPKADAVLFMLSAEQPASEAELDFLKEVSGHAGKVFLVLNKADLLDAAELRQSLEFTRRAVAGALQAGAEIYPVSARRALRGGDAGFDAFGAALERFLRHDKDDVLLATVARRALRLVSQASFEAELAQKALAAPLAELEEKLGRFAARKDALVAARDEHAILADGEGRKLLRGTVEPDLQAFEEQLVGELSAFVERRFEEGGDLSLRALQEALHREAIERIRQGFDAWRSAEDEKVARAFEQVCRRLASRVDAEVDELYRFASDLFAVPYHAVASETPWGMEERFYYKFWDEPTSLHMLASSAVAALPRSIAGGLVRRRARERAIDTARTQSGRVRYDFQRRLEESVRAFKERMSAYVEAVLDGLESALRRGEAAQRSGTSHASARRDSLAASLRRLDEARAKIESALAALEAS